MDTYKARDIFHKTAERPRLCGDPGIQYDTTINYYVREDLPHPREQPVLRGRFSATTACNLASLNLMKFVDADGGVDPRPIQFQPR